MMPGGRYPPGAGLFPPGAGAGRRRAAPRHDPLLMGVAAALLQQIAQLERKPPVTIALVTCELMCHVAIIEAKCVAPSQPLRNLSPPAVQVLAFLRPEGFKFLPTIRQGCLQPAAVLRGQARGWLACLDLLHVMIAASLSQVDAGSRSPPGPAVVSPAVCTLPARRLHAPLLQHVLVREGPVQQRAAAAAAGAGAAPPGG